MNKIFTAIMAAGAFTMLLPTDAEALGRRMTVTEFQALTSGQAPESPVYKAAMPRLQGEAASGEESVRIPRNMTATAKVPSKVMQRVTAGGTNVFGYLFYSNDENMPFGFYSLEPEGYSLMWEDPFVERAGQIYAGWERNGVLYAVVLMVNDSGRTYAYNVQCDLYTGDIFDARQVPSGGSYFTVAALNKGDGCIYGVASEGSNWVFARAASGAPDIVTPICAADNAHNFLSLTYNEEDGKLYGVNLNFDFVTVDTDGTVNVLTHVKTEKTPGDYQSGLIYSLSERQFYWNVCYADDTAALYTIDPVDYTFQLVENYPENEEFAFFVSPDGKVDPSLPAAPEFAGADFGQGNLSGTVSFTLPTATAGGKELSGELSWQAWLDNIEYRSGKGTPGSTVTLDFTDLATGRHTFALSAISGDKESMRGRQSVYVGKDKPKAPFIATLEENGRLTWEPVTSGLNGGYIDLSTLRYHVVDANGKEVAVTTDNTWQTTLPADQLQQAYRFGVIAEYGREYESGTTWSNYCVVGQPYTVPFNVVPDTPESLLFTTDDVNGDGLGWIYDDGYEFGTEEAFKCYVGMEDSDDWLFLPAVELPEANKVYTLSFDARLLSWLFTGESLQVFAGDRPSPEAMTETLTDVFSPTADYMEFSGFLVPHEKGVKYVGIRCTSKAGMAGVALRNFSIADRGVSALTPSQPTEVSVKTAPEGKLSATVTLTLPTEDLKGDKLPAGEKLTATVYNNTAGARSYKTEGLPGEKVTIELNTITGNNELELIITSGDLESVPMALSVYSGEALPVRVDGLSASKSEDMMSMTIKWQPVTEGAQGGYVNPETVTYNISRLDRTGFGSFWNEVATGVSATEYTYTLPEGSRQDYVWLAVTAVTSAGTCPDRVAVAEVIGTPYALGMKEDFGSMESDNDFTLSPYVISQPTPLYTGEWDAVRPDQISTQLNGQGGFYFIGYGEPGSKGRIGIPCFTTRVENAVLNLSTLSCYGVALVDVYASCYGVAPEFIGKASLSTSLAPHTDVIPLPDKFAGKDWVQIYFDCSFEDNAQLGAIRSFAIYGVTGVKETPAESDLRVWGGTGELTVAGAEGETIRVFSVDGRMAASAERASNLETFRLPAGIYIVNGHKVAVR